MSGLSNSRKYHNYNSKKSSNQNRKRLNLTKANTEYYTHIDTMHYLYIIIQEVVLKMELKMICDNKKMELKDEILLSKYIEKVKDVLVASTTYLKK